MGTVYAVLGDVENALDLMEEMADLCEKFIGIVKGGKKTYLFDTGEICGWNDSWNEEDIRGRLFSWYTDFVNAYAGKENNPIVTSPRYRAVMDRIRDSRG